MEDMEFILLQKLEKIKTAQWLWIVAALILIGAVTLWNIHYRKAEGKKGVKILAIIAMCFFVAVFAVQMIAIMALSPAEYDPAVLPKAISYLLPAIAILAALVLYIAGIIVGVSDRETVPHKTDVRALTYGAICVAMAFVLSYIKMFSAPQGGSVTLASMLPIMLYAYMYGTRRGLLVGLVYGLLQFIQKPEITHWAQVVLDYPLAFAAIGFAGISKHIPAKIFALPIGTIIGGAARWAVHTLSGFLFFSQVLNKDALMVSVFYNGWYMLFDTLICFVLAFPLAALVMHAGIGPKAKKPEAVKNEA